MSASPPSAPLDAIETWAFDLDNTLYPAWCDLFALIDVKMTEFVARELSLDLAQARFLQKDYYHRHGTTLNGLMREHGLSPRAFLDYVHDISLERLAAAPDLRAELHGLNGRRLIYTNGSTRHAERVLGALGVLDLFDGIFCIESSRFEPKPSADGFARFLQWSGAVPARTAFFEDLARNLAPAKAVGMTTILVRSGPSWGHEPGNEKADLPHVDWVTEDLKAFLADIPAKG